MTRPRTNQILQRVRNGQVAVGINIQTSSPEMVEMVGFSQYDYAMLDWEHGSYGTDTLVQLIRASEAVGLTAIVRIPDTDPITVMRVLDAGASGLVAPQVSTVAQAEQVLRAARYFDGSNIGNRGACPSGRATGHLVPNWKEFTARSNREVFVALGFECVESIDNFDAMADIGGMDAVFLGAFDLAQSMGYAGEMYHPEVMKQLERLMDKARARRIPVFGTLVSGSPEEARKDMEKWIGYGAQIMNVMSDRRLAMLGLKARLDAVRIGTAA